MGNEVKYQALVGDVLRLLVERAAQAGGPPGPFDQGVKMGYFEAVASIMNELETFGIDAKDVGMEGFDPLTMLIRKAA